MATEVKGRKLERGMLLLVPESDAKGPQVCAVSSPQVLIASYHYFSAKFTLTDPVAPEGWTLLDAPALAQHLLDNPTLLAALGAEPANKQEGR